MKALAMAIVLAFSGVASANEFDDLTVQAAFPGCTKTRCYIGFNPGGNLYTFSEAVRIMGRDHYHVVIGGEACASACAMAADTLRKNGADVCVLPSVSFFFHKASRKIADANNQWVVFERFDTPQSPEVAHYIKRHGGEPLGNTLETMLRMPIEDAVRYWRQCEPSEVH